MVLVAKEHFMKKCKKCGAPLEGFLYNTIGKLMGIKPSASDPEVCNKCAEEGVAPAVAPQKAAEPVAPAPTPAPAPTAPVEPQAEPEKKDDFQI